MGDPQVDNPKELDFARRTIYQELRARRDLDFVIVLGDLVNENPALIAPSEATLDSLGCPWMRIQGNHDGQDFPADTTFVLGGVRYILLNRYSLRENRQNIPDSVSLRLLGSIEPGQKTIVCTHVPIKDSIMEKYGSDVFFVSAHEHIIIRRMLRCGAEFLCAGATCGSFWRGVRDSDGIPNALMNCGAPRGYFIADIDPSRNDWHRLSYKCVGRKTSEKLSVHLRDGRLVFNVYGGSRAGRLQARIGGKWYSIPFNGVVAPEAQDIIDWNKANMTRERRRTSREEYIPMRTLKSTHTWTVEVPSGLTQKKIRVRYADPSSSFRTTAVIR